MEKLLDLLLVVDRSQEGIHIFDRFALHQLENFPDLRSALSRRELSNMEVQERLPRLDVFRNILLVDILHELVHSLQILLLALFKDLSLRAIMDIDNAFELADYFLSDDLVLIVLAIA